VIQDVLDDARRTLKAGGHVWIVSGSKFEIGSFKSEPAPPRYRANPGLMDTMSLMAYWQDAAAYFLQQHSIQHKDVAIPVAEDVSKYENATLSMVSGWRE
jgi:hypothetical protein